MAAAARVRHFSRRTELAYVGWIRRFIFFHHKRHPALMGGPEVTEFLSHLAMHDRVSPSTQNQALAALLFLFREVLGQGLPWLQEVVRARRPKRLPIVLTRDEVQAVLERLVGTPRLMAGLLYGTGLRLLECARLRVQDVDFGRSQIIVRGGKGDRDRVTLLPQSIAPALEEHLQRVSRLHRADRAQGAGWVALPGGLERKYPDAGREWAWQWVFPATRIYTDSGPVAGAATTFTPRCCNGPSSRRCHGPDWRNELPVTPSGIPSPPTSSRTAMTSAPSKSSWATATSARP